MSALAKPFVTPEQYLEIERKAEYKSEYHSGQMFAMAGASREHNLITTNVVGELRSFLRGRPCEIYPSDMRVLVSATGLYTYPDVSVTCGEPEFLDGSLDVLLNPLVVVEVLSPSTESYDRGAKFALYQRLPSLQEYLLVSQNVPQVERYARQPDGRWLYELVGGVEAVVTLEALGVTLPLAEIFDRVTFPPDGAGTISQMQQTGEHTR